MHSSAMKKYVVFSDEIVRVVTNKGSQSRTFGQQEV